MSDVHCPATIVCAGPPADQVGAQALADALRGRRIAAVFSGDAPESRRTVETVAASLRVAVTTCPSLRPGPAGSASDADVVARHRDQLETIADLHRGETVLVVGDLAVLEVVATGLGRNIAEAWTEDHALGIDETVELDRDADGWLLRRWGSERLV